MFRVTRINDFTTMGANRASAVWQTATSQPSWLGRAVLMTFIIVIAIPIFVLVLLALLMASIVFAALWSVNYLMIRLRGILPRSNDGRKNVRVIRRDGASDQR